MPDQLDDFDLEPSERDDDTIRAPEGLLPTSERPRPGIGFPMILAVVGILVIGLLGVLFLVFRQPAKPAATPVPIAPAPAPAAPAASPAVTLPPLEESDSFVRGLAEGLSSHPEVARWLARNALVRTLAVVVDNVASGETPRPHLGFLAPKQRFKARPSGRDQHVADTRGFAGYDAFADAVASVDAAAAATAYRTLEPLFDAAYVELGHPGGGFGQALDKAIQALLAVPVLREDTRLVPHATAFRYVDPKLEGLTAAQKQFLRVGPRNVRIVQGKLRELQQALAPQATPAAAEAR